MRIGIPQLICLAVGVFMLSIGGGLVGGRLAAQRLTVPSSEAPARVAEEAEPFPAGATPETSPSQPDESMMEKAGPHEQPEAPPKKSPEPASASSTRTRSTAGVKTPAIKEASESHRLNYAVQVLSTQTLHDARMAERTAKAKGFPARVFEVDLGDKGKWYRVCVGPYGSEAEAESVVKDVRRIPGFQKSFVKFLE